MVVTVLVNAKMNVDIDMISSVLANVVVSVFGVEEAVEVALVADALFAFDVSYWFGLGDE